jgi:hypothetical protein
MSLRGWMLWVMVGCVIASASCGRGTDGSIADGPADCAGPSRVAEGRTRFEAWARAVAALRQSDQPQSVWIGFSDLVGTEDATSMFSTTQIEGIRMAWREQQGTTAKGNFPVRPPVAGADLVPIVRRFLDFQLASSVGPFAPADGAVGSGAPVLAGLNLRVTNKEFASLLDENRCLIYSVELGAGAPAFLSPRIEPDAGPVSTDTRPTGATATR